MEFTYSSYENLLRLFRKNGYYFSSYHSYNAYEKPVILRHDIDFDIGKAVILAELENSLGVCSTYFVLLTSSFYNVLASDSVRLIKRIHSLGHEIGLHFDETQYEITNDRVRFKECVDNEISIMQRALGITIRCLSMHRPSCFVLENDLEFEGLVNSYSKKFFQEFKYISDSRMNWRENIVEIVPSKKYEKLHLLIHPFWYSKNPEGIRNKLLTFITSANRERYLSLKDNFRDLQEFIGLEDI
jgi:peptidoglycan/xylan/chitin deacetylase (PgdA/CDA1 family)